MEKRQEMEKKIMEDFQREAQRFEEIRNASNPLVIELVKSLSTNDIDYIKLQFDLIKERTMKEGEEGIEEEDLKSKNKLVPPEMDEETFLQTIESIYKMDNEGIPKKIHDKAKEVVMTTAKELFQFVAEDVNDPRNPMKKLLKWTKFLDYLLIALNPTIEMTPPSKEEIDYMIRRKDLKLNHGNYILQITDAGHCKAPKREPITAITSIDCPTDGTFCYILISRHGKVGIYSLSLDLLFSYHLCSGSTDLELYRYKTRYWITDCVYIPKAKTLLISDTNRSLFVIDASVVHHEQKFRITGFPAAITCLYCYEKPDSEETNETSLLIGDECGMVTDITFHQANKSLFQPPMPGNNGDYFWPQVLKMQNEWVTATPRDSVHPHSPIDKIMFYDQINAVVTCCKRLGQVCVQTRGSGLPPYKIEEKRSISCFDVCNDGLSRVGLVTGGQDGILRIWISRTPKYPQTEIKAHLTPIVQVRWQTPDGLISVSKEGEIRIWNHVFISGLEWNCVQTTTVRCEALNAPGQPVYWPIKALYNGPKGTDEMLLVCDCHLIRMRNEDDRKLNETKSENDEKKYQPPPMERMPIFDQQSMSYLRALESKINHSKCHLNEILIDNAAPHLTLKLDDINFMDEQNKKSENDGTDSQKSSDIQK